MRITRLMEDSQVNARGRVNHMSWVVLVLCKAITPTLPHPLINNRAW